MTPLLPTIVPLSLFPPEPQGFILNGSFLGLYEVNSCSESHFESKIKSDICCLRTFNPILQILPSALAAVTHTVHG